MLNDPDVQNSASLVRETDTSVSPSVRDSQDAQEEQDDPEDDRSVADLAEAESHRELATDRRIDGPDEPPVRPRRHRRRHYDGHEEPVGPRNGEGVQIQRAEGETEEPRGAGDDGERDGIDGFTATVANRHSVTVSPQHKICEGRDRVLSMETTSQGDPRVLFVMNLVLSSVFAAVVIWGLSTVDITQFTIVNVGSLALVVMAATYLITR